MYIYIYTYYFLCELGKTILRYESDSGKIDVNGNLQLSPSSSSVIIIGRSISRIYPTPLFSISFHLSYQVNIFAYSVSDNGLIELFCHKI